jgi:multimeric flavodoxin WrbA
VIVELLATGPAALGPPVPATGRVATVWVTSTFPKSSVSCTATTRFCPTVAHDCKPSGRAGQAIHGCAQYPEDFDSINHFFLISQMIVPGSSYWNIGIGRAKGEVERDEKALRTMEALGQNMAWLLKKINS